MWEGTLGYLEGNLEAYNGAREVIIGYNIERGRGMLYPYWGVG